MNWRRFADEMPPERPWAHVLLREEGSEQAALIWCDGEGRGWLGFHESAAMTLSDIRDVAGMVGGSKGFTHWLLIEPPAEEGECQCARYEWRLENHDGVHHNLCPQHGASS